MSLRVIARLAVANAPTRVPARAMGYKYAGHDGFENWAPIEAPSQGTPSVDPSEKPFLGSNLLLQWAEGVKRYGWQRTIVQAYTMGMIKFGTCVGEDVNGNRYYENMDYPHGQHRWVEFKDVHNPDVSSVPPEWHGWHTQMQDAPGPSSQNYLEEKLAASQLVAGDTSADSTQVYTDHVGLNATGYATEPIMNKSTIRARGYKIGGVNQLPDEPDQYHVHPGHAQNKSGQGRYLSQKKLHVWDPAKDPEVKEMPQPIRSPDVN